MRLLHTDYAALLARMRETRAGRLDRSGVAFPLGQVFRCVPCQSTQPFLGVFCRRCYFLSLQPRPALLGLAWRVGATCSQRMYGEERAGRARPLA